MARYLDRGYWERRKDQQSSGVGGASRGVAPPTQSGVSNNRFILSHFINCVCVCVLCIVCVQVIPAPVNDGVTTSPLASTVHSTVQQFVKQMQEVSTAGGSVAADPIILSLYQTLNALHPQLLKQIDDVQQQKGVYMIYTVLCCVCDMCVCTFTSSVCIIRQCTCVYVSIYVLVCDSVVR